MALAAMLAGGEAAASNGWRTVGAEGAIAVEGNEGRVRATLENLSEPDLKEFYLHCCRQSLRGRLANGEIAMCSAGYELLLKRAFGGDFLALLEWRRRAVRATPVPSPW